MPCRARARSLLLAAVWALIPAELRAEKPTLGVLIAALQAGDHPRFVQLAANVSPTVLADALAQGSPSEQRTAALAARHCPAPVSLLGPLARVMARADSAVSPVAARSLLVITAAARPGDLGEYSREALHDALAPALRLVEEDARVRADLRAAAALLQEWSDANGVTEPAAP